MCTCYWLNSCNVLSQSSNNEACRVVTLLLCVAHSASLCGTFYNKEYIICQTKISSVSSSLNFFSHLLKRQTNMDGGCIFQVVFLRLCACSLRRCLYRLSINVLVSGSQRDSGANVAQTWPHLLLLTNYDDSPCIYLFVLFQMPVSRKESNW